MFEIDPGSLVDTRIQLHWATQLLGGTADATLEKASDDSHSNLDWDAESRTLQGRAGCNLNVREFELQTMDASVALTGMTLAEALSWLSDQLRVTIATRDYDMPEHGVSNGLPFSPKARHLAEIADWFSFAQDHLAGNGELRVWPHHFDLGFWSAGDLPDRSIGGGFSPGDGHIAEPFFYINPYGIEKPEELPDVSPGRWTDDWFGAVLNASDIIEQSNQHAFTRDFIQRAVDVCQQLISDKE